MKPVIKYADRYNTGGTWGARKFMSYIQRALKRMGRREVVEAMQPSLASAGAWLPLRHQLRIDFYNIRDILGFTPPHTYREFSDLVSPPTDGENDALHDRVLAFCALLSDEDYPDYTIAWNAGDPYLSVAFGLPSIG